jgi:hydroxymethylbilane synthase
MTALAVAAERGAMIALEGSCRTAIGAHADLRRRPSAADHRNAGPDGSARWRRSGEMGDIHAPAAEAAAHALGLTLGHEVHLAAGDQEVAPEG